MSEDSPTPEQTLEQFREWVTRNGHYRCTCGEELNAHWADLSGCEYKAECNGFNLDPDPLVNKLTTGESV